MIRIMLVDDHRVVREGLKAIFAQSSDIEVVEEASSAEQALEMMEGLQPDVLLLDISLPGMNGLECLQKIVQSWPEVKVIVLSMHSEQAYALRAIRAGAMGYVTKDTAAENLEAAIREVISGKKYITDAVAQLLVDEVSEGRAAVKALSDREEAVLKHLGSGLTLTEIASVMSLSPKTISTYRSRIMTKLNLANNAELIRYALEHGFGSR